MAISGKGTILRRWNSATPAWEEIAEVNSISGPGMSRETIDTTHLRTSGGYRTFIASFRTPGTLSFSMNFTRDGYDTVKTDFEDDDAQNYEIILPDDESTSIEFEGYVTELPLNIVPDDKITCDISMQVSGEVTIESGSGPSPA